MNDINMLGAGLIGLAIGIIPQVTAWLKAKFSKKASQEKLEDLKLQKQVEDMQRMSQEAHAQTQEMLSSMSQTLDRIGSVHGLNPDDIECKQDINDELERFRIYAKADRVTVWSFHNGNYFSTGIPQRKLTTVFEAIPPDKEEASEYDIVHNELLNGFALVLKRLNLGAVQNRGGTPMDPGMTVYSSCEKCPLFKQCNVLPTQRPYNCILRCDIDNMPMNSKFFRVMKQLGTKVWYGRTICNELGKPVGVISVQYTTNSEQAEQFLQNCSQEWCDTCTRIISSISYMFDIG